MHLPAQVRSIVIFCFLFFWSAAESQVAWKTVRSTELTAHGWFRARLRVIVPDVVGAVSCAAVRETSYVQSIVTHHETQFTSTYKK